MKRFCRDCETTAEPVRIPRIEHGVFEVIAWMIPTAFFILGVFRTYQQIEFQNEFGHVNDTMIVSSGYAVLTAIAWSFLAIAVSTYRRLALPDRCQGCKSKNLIPANTPLAQRTLSQAQ